jgi:RHS repeat-associated protein
MFTYGNANWGSGSLTYSTEAQEGLPWASAAVLGNDVHNLGWGYRFTSGAWPTVEAMMVDIDGDGLLDRVIDASQDQDGYVYACNARWFRNAGSGSFVDMGLIPLPTLKWAGTGDAWGQKPDGTRAFAREDLAAGANERCALNYQLTDYINSSRPEGTIVCPGLGTCPGSAPNDPNYPLPAYCNAQGQLDYGTDCTDKHSGGTFETILAYRWIDFDDDGKVDLVASIARGGYYDYNLDQGDLPGAAQEPALFQPPDSPNRWPDCPASSYTAFPGNPFPSDSIQPYTHCGGMFAWFVYKNKGNGQFGNPQDGAPPLPDQIVYQPIPLETSGGDSSVTNAPVGQDQGWLDIDGDGRSDAVVGPEAGGAWKVFRNAADGTGQLVPVTGSSSFPFSVRPSVGLNRTDCPANSDGSCNPISQQGLTDINGDGLVDQWIATGSDSSTSNVSMNDGTSFELFTGSGEYNLALRPGNDGSCTGTGTNGFVSSGSRFDTLRLLDTDLDGRVDVLENNSTHFNEGAGFGSAVGILGDGLALQHRVVATANQLEDYMSFAGGTPTPYAWELRSDEIDLDGDGIPEGVDFGTLPQSPEMDVSRVTTPTQPPRLLVGINNGRGATTSIAYAPLSKTSVVTQEPDQGEASPHTQWVVSSVTVTDSFANTISTSSYVYKDPKWAPDDQGRYGFRGFAEVTTTGQSGAKTTERYSFSPDWSGRLAETLVLPAENQQDPPLVSSISATTWTPFQLFAGSITTYHPTLQKHYTCANGQPEATCLMFPAGYTQTTSTLTQQYATTPASGGTPLLWAETKTVLQSGTTNANGDRMTLRQYGLYGDESTYRLRPLTSTRFLRVGPVFGMRAESAQTWDASYRMAQTDEVWIDWNDNDRLITHHDYDSVTGNETARWKPEQWAMGTTKTTFEYDTRAVSPTKVIDELGHLVTYAYEPGTGTRLSTIGPNVADCAATSSCPTGTPNDEEHVIRIDGLGREIESYDTFSYDGSSYSYVRTGITNYTEASPSGNPPTPASITSQHLIDATANSFDMQETDLDGHGRPIRKTVSTFGSVPADAVTTFTYGNDGTLQAVSVPDPSHNDSSTVTYTYTFDSLGRGTSIRRPDNTTPSQRSGLDISYDGLTKTSQEVIPAGGTPPATTVTKTDSYGRLAEVDELIAAPSNFATTLYQYDANDNVEEVDAPEGVTTVLDHDLDSRRTSITRGARTWTYTYDRNGNIVTEQVPGSSGPETDADYTTTTVYDDLDRPISRAPGPRTLDSTDQALFGAGSEQFVWDVGANHVGRLRYWRSFAPGASTPTIERDLGVNAQGLSTTTTENVIVGSYSAMSRTFAQDFFENGVPKSFTYNDQFSGSDATSAIVGIDARGLPSGVSIRGVGCQQSGLGQTGIAMSRNVAGLVTSRTTINPEATWTYDALGRVTNQTVTGSAQIVRQDLAYFGDDDPSSLDHYLGTTQRHFNFTYDARHQLVGTHETTSPGYFDATYTFGDGGRFTHATEGTTGAPGSEVTPRDVGYEYAGDDPEEVTALRNGSDNSAFAVYGYDEAGNQTTRSYTGTQEGWDYTYDGQDQLRRAVRKLAGVIQSSEEYWYDENNKRVLTVKRDASGNQTELVWWIGDVEAHYDGAGNPLRNDSYVTVGTSLFRLTRNRACATGIVMPFDFLFHGLGDSTIATVDRFGATGTAMSYGPFGELLETVGDASGEHRRMNDKYVDDVSGLAYYGARYYDKLSMTWTQSDPLYRFAPDAAWTQPRQAALYTNDLNNPLKYSDPDGRQVVALRPPLAPPTSIPAAVYDVGVIAVVVIVYIYSGPDPEPTAPPSSSLPPVQPQTVGPTVSTSPQEPPPPAGDEGEGPPGTGDPYRTPGKNEPDKGPKIPPSRPNVPKPGPTAPPPDQPQRRPPGPGNPFDVPIGPDHPDPPKPPSKDHPYRAGTPQQSKQSSSTNSNGKKKPVVVHDTEPVKDSMDVRAF